MANKKNTKLSNSATPTQVKVTMYNVGFGDCFLLTFTYSEEKSVRILIDCGSTSKRKEHMSKAVDRIIKDCEGKVDAIVITHRHKDHLSAFGLSGIGVKLEKLNPKVVIQPWTEHPKAKKGALKAQGIFTINAVNYLKSIEDAEQFAQYAIKDPDKILSAAGKYTKKQILRIAELNIPNKKAVLRLRKMGTRHAYVYTGSKSGLENILPGVDISVLGPPTLKQTENIRQQTNWDKDEFWKLRNRLASTNISNKTTARGKSYLFPDSKTTSISGSPSYTKWMIKRLDSIQTENVKQIVRILDNALNNTSVILLFKIGKKALLFSGDAQLENWEYALKNKNIRKELKNVSLYKVGHHGSTNATPQSLWALFSRRGRKRTPLISLLSTKKGHHSGVPRKSLMKALESETILENTQKWGRKLKEEYII